MFLVEVEKIISFLSFHLLMFMKYISCFDKVF